MPIGIKGLVTTRRYETGHLVKWDGQFLRSSDNAQRVLSFY